MSGYGCFSGSCRKSNNCHALRAPPVLMVQIFRKLQARFRRLLRSCLGPGWAASPTRTPLRPFKRFRSVCWVGLIPLLLDLIEKCLLTCFMETFQIFAKTFRCCWVKERQYLPWAASPRPSVACSHGTLQIFTAPRGFTFQHFVQVKYADGTLLALESGRCMMVFGRICAISCPADSAASTVASVLRLGPVLLAASFTCCFSLVVHLKALTAASKFSGEFLHKDPKEARTLGLSGRVWSLHGYFSKITGVPFLRHLAQTNHEADDWPLGSAHPCCAVNVRYERS